MHQWSPTLRETKGELGNLLTFIVTRIHRDVRRPAMSIWTHCAPGRAREWNTMRVQGRAKNRQLIEKTCVSIKRPSQVSTLTPMETACY